MLSCFSIAIVNQFRQLPISVIFKVEIRSHLYRLHGMYHYLSEKILCTVPTFKYLDEYPWRINNFESLKIVKWVR